MIQSLNLLAGVLWDAGCTVGWRETSTWVQRAESGFFLSHCPYIACILLSALDLDLRVKLTAGNIVQRLREERDGSLPLALPQVRSLWFLQHQASLSVNLWYLPPVILIVIILIIKLTKLLWSFIIVYLTLCFSWRIFFPTSEVTNSCTLEHYIIF